MWFRHQHNWFCTRKVHIWAEKGVLLRAVQLDLIEFVCWLNPRTVFSINSQRSGWVSTMQLECASVLLHPINNLCCTLVFPLRGFVLRNLKLCTGKSISIEVWTCVWNHQLIMGKWSLSHDQTRSLQISFFVLVPENWTVSCSSHSPSRPYVVLHLGLCFLFAQKECPSLEDHTLIFCAGGQRSVWYLPEVLCQSAINRLKGHPHPSCNPALRHSHRPPAYSQPGTPLRCCAWWKCNEHSAMTLC